MAKPAKDCVLPNSVEINGELQRLYCIACPENDAIPYAYVYGRDLKHALEQLAELHVISKDMLRMIGGS